MNYTVWDYFVPTLGLLGFTLVGILAFSLYIHSCSKDRNKHAKLLSKVPHIYWISLAIILLVSVYAIPSVMKWAYLFDDTSIETTVGTVEDVRSAGVVPLYYNRANHRLSTPSYVTVSGVDYYILSGEGIHSGDNIVITYCTDGETVKSWEVISPNESTQLPQQSTETSPKEEPVTTATKKHLDPTLFIMLMGTTLLMLGALNQKIHSWRIAYLTAHSNVVEGVVAPRRVTVASCMLEFIISFFALLSILTKSIALTAILCVLALCLWGLQLGVQWTSILFNNGRFTYTSLAGNHTYTLSDIQQVDYCKTRQGFMQLRIVLQNEKSIRLSQLHFSGLEEFYFWVSKNDRSLKFEKSE
jgi:hypothetical protein